jgi:hypothetical protein
MSPRVFICTGKSCRKRKRKYAALKDTLHDIVALEEVPCQKICKGPIAGTPVKGHLEWFKRVDTKKSRKGLVKLAVRGKRNKALMRRCIKRISGKLR